MSVIPGQMIDENQEISVPMLLIALFGATLAFLLSLSWAAFLNDSVDAVFKVSQNRLPLPVARLISAVIVSGVATGLFIALYTWERKVTQQRQEKEAAQ